MTLVQPMTIANGQATQTHLEVISRLQGLIDAALAPSLETLKAGRYALLDVPDHGNVGDSAIWAGEVAWLEKNVAKEPMFVCDHRDPLVQVNTGCSGCTILLHGGGNFGDIWPQFQNFREAVILSNPEKPIIQLPQSFHYGDLTAVQKTKEKLAMAQNLRLLVRDHESYDLAEAHFNCDVALCPDMAFALGPLGKIGMPDLDVLLLLRTDKESRGHETGNWPEKWEEADWLVDDPDMHRDALRDTRLSALFALDPTKLSKRARRNYYYNQLAERRLHRGIRQLSRARFVITDRLHVHIVSTLLGLPHCFLDNHYGKISRFSAAFSTKWFDCFQAKTLPDAVACARAWLELANARHD